MGGTVKKIVKPITSVFDPPQPKVPKINLPSPAAAGKKVAEALPTEPPSRSSSGVQEAAEEVRRRARQGRGRSSTIITALSGDIPTGSVIRKALLGGN